MGVVAPRVLRCNSVNIIVFKYEYIMLSNYTIFEICYVVTAFTSTASLMFLSSLFFTYNLHDSITESSNEVVETNFIFFLGPLSSSSRDVCLKLKSFSFVSGALSCGRFISSWILFPLMISYDLMFRKPAFLSSEENVLCAINWPELWSAIDGVRKIQPRNILDFQLLLLYFGIASLRLICKNKTNKILLLHK